jgi:hypothetical protein
MRLQLTTSQQGISKSLYGADVNIQVKWPC